MASTASDAAAPATFTAEQLLLGLLDLIKATHSASELTVERVSAAMKQPARTFGPGHFGYGGTLTPEWGYGLEVKKAGAPGARLDLDFIDITPGKKALATAICKVDFERFSSELQHAGFSREAVRGEHGRIIYNRFDRPDLSIKVDTLPENNIPSGAAAHPCVRLVTVQ
jgi:hypothetical protein